MREGGVKKILNFVVIGATLIIDKTNIFPFPLGDAVMFYIIITEFYSIYENYKKITGNDIPKIEEIKKESEEIKK